MMISAIEKGLTVNFPIHVTFDSNTIEYVLGVKQYDAQTIGPYFDAQLSKDYAFLRNAISTGKIIPYLSDGYFTVEAIEKQQRKSQMGKPPKISVTVSQSSSMTVPMSFSLAPAVHVELNPHFEAVRRALETVKGKVLSLYRIGFPICDEVKPLHVNWDSNEKQTLQDYQERVQQITKYIEDKLDGGFKHLKQVLQKNILGNPIPKAKDNSFYRNRIREGDIILLLADNNFPPKKLASLISELADCDMVCAHWAYKNDFICTCDISKRQGRSGILHPDNRKKLNAKFPIRILSPDALVREISPESFM